MTVFIFKYHARNALLLLERFNIHVLPRNVCICVFYVCFSAVQFLYTMFFNLHCSIIILELQLFKFLDVLKVRSNNVGFY